EIAGMMAAHHAQTDQARPQILSHAHAPASAIVLTATTVRSRSESVVLGCTGRDTTGFAGRVNVDWSFMKFQSPTLVAVVPLRQRWCGWRWSRRRGPGGGCRPSSRRW